MKRFGGSGTGDLSPSPSPITRPRGRAVTEWLKASLRDAFSGESRPTSTALKVVPPCPGNARRPRRQDYNRCRPQRAGLGRTTRSRLRESDRTLLKDRHRKPKRKTGAKQACISAYQLHDSRAGDVVICLPGNLLLAQMRALGVGSLGGNPRLLCLV